MTRKLFAPSHAETFLLGLVLAVVCFAIAACSSLGMAPTDTFEKRVAAGIVTVDAVATAADNALTSGKLSKQDAQNVAAGARVALSGIMVAQKLYTDACPLRPVLETPDPACKSAEAATKLDSTLAVLTALQSYLATKGAK